MITVDFKFLLLIIIFDHLSILIKLINFYFLIIDYRLFIKNLILFIVFKYLYLKFFIYFTITILQIINLNLKLMF